MSNEYVDNASIVSKHSEASSSITPDRGISTKKVSIESTGTTQRGELRRVPKKSSVDTQTKDRTPYLRTEI